MGEVGEGSGHKDKPLAVARERIWQVTWRSALLLYSLLCCCEKCKQVVVGGVYFSLYFLLSAAHGETLGQELKWKPEETMQECYLLASSLNQGPLPFFHSSSSQ